MCASCCQKHTTTLCGECNEKYFAECINVWGQSRLLHTLQVAGQGVPLARALADSIYHEVTPQGAILHSSSCCQPMKLNMVARFMHDSMTNFNADCLCNRSLLPFQLSF